MAFLVLFGPFWSFWVLFDPFYVESSGNQKPSFFFHLLRAGQGEYSCNACNLAISRYCRGSYWEAGKVSVPPKPKL